MSSWGLSTAAVLGLTALVVDSSRLLLERVDLFNALGGGLTAAALGIVIGLLAGMGVAVWGELARAIGRSCPGSKPLWPLAGAVPVGLTAAAILDVGQAGHGTMRAGMALVIAGVGTALTWVAYRPQRPAARVIGLSIACVALICQIQASSWHYREIHDLLVFLGFLGLLALCTGLRRTLALLRAGRLVRRELAALVSAVTLLLLVEPLVPGWRPAAADTNLYGSVFSRTVRWLADFDGDGFSAIAWGGDCDDLDVGKNPFALDVPGGGDANCNGIDPPASVVDGDLGLAPARGDPRLGSPAPLVLFLTVDAFRDEAFRPELVPELVQASRRALALRRTYAAGTRTALSLPITQRGWLGGEPIAARAAASGIRTSLIFGVGAPMILAQIATGFDKVAAPARGRWNAAQVTDRVLAELREQTPEVPLYLWAHYYDAHSPYPTVGRSDLLLPDGLSEAYLRYGAGLRSIDREIGRLFAGLREDGWLDRAVVVLTGDHGEGFGEHGVIYHSVSAFEELARVPALLWAPGMRAGTTNLLASHSDVYPTLSGALGLFHPADERFGRSWLRLRQGTLDPLHDFVVVRSAQAARGGEIISPMLALITGRHKLVQVLEGNVVDLYDLASDPGERRNVSWRQRGRSHELQRRLALYRDIEGYPAENERGDLRYYRGNFVVENGGRHGAGALAGVGAVLR